MTTKLSTHIQVSDLHSVLAGPCLLLDTEGVPLGRGRLEQRDDRLQLRAVTPSGALASAFFGQGRRRFLLALPDGTTFPVLIRDCRWYDGERFCDLVPTVDAAAA